MKFENTHIYHSLKLTLTPMGTCNLDISFKYNIFSHQFLDKKLQKLSLSLQMPKKIIYYREYLKKFFFFHSQKKKY